MKYEIFNLHTKYSNLVFLFRVISNEITNLQAWTNSCYHSRNIFAHLMGCVGAGLIKFQLHTQSFGATGIVRLLVWKALDATGTICDGLVCFVKLYFYYLCQFFLRLLSPHFSFYFRSESVYLLLFSHRLYWNNWHRRQKCYSNVFVLLTYLAPEILK